MLAAYDVALLVLIAALFHEWLSQFEALDFAGLGLRQCVDKADRARIFVGRDHRLHVILQPLDAERVAADAGFATRQRPRRSARVRCRGRRPPRIRPHRRAAAAPPRPPGPRYYSRPTRSYRRRGRQNENGLAYRTGMRRPSGSSRRAHRMSAARRRDSGSRSARARQAVRSCPARPPSCPHRQSWLRSRSRVFRSRRRRHRRSGW